MKRRPEIVSTSEGKPPPRGITRRTALMVSTMQEYPQPPCKSAQAFERVIVTVRKRNISCGPKLTRYANKPTWPAKALPSPAIRLRESACV